MRLNRLAREAGVRDKSLFHGDAGYLEMHFGPKQRQVLCGLLNEIEENIPCRTSSARIFSEFSRVEQSSKSQTSQHL
jgi:hypothetical protein